jgi:hypothetical protein
VFGRGKYQKIKEWVVDLQNLRWWLLLPKVKWLKLVKRVRIS